MCPLSLKWRTLQFCNEFRRCLASSLLGNRLSLPLKYKCIINTKFSQDDLIRKLRHLNIRNQRTRISLGNKSKDWKKSNTTQISKPNQWKYEIFVKTCEEALQTISILLNQQTIFDILWTNPCHDIKRVTYRRRRMHSCYNKKQTNKVVHHRIIDTWQGLVLQLWQHGDEN